MAQIITMMMMMMRMIINIRLGDNLGGCVCGGLDCEHETRRGGNKNTERVVVTRDGEKREINRTAQTKSNERVVSGYFVNVLEVQEALSGRRWTKCLFAWPAGLASPAGWFGTSFFAPFISLVVRVGEYLSPFALSLHACRPAPWSSSRIRL